MTRRMISDHVMESDEFLDMPLSAQALYAHLVLHSDNWGFTSQLNIIRRMIGATQSDVDCLVEKGFLMRFPGTSVVCIRHWNVMNSISGKGRSEFQEARLVRKDGGVYVYKGDEDFEE